MFSSTKKFILPLVILIFGLIFTLLEFRIIHLERTIQSLKQAGSSQLVVPETKPELPQYNTYELTDGALVEQKPDGTKEVLVADLKQTGVNNFLCGDISNVYLAAQPGPTEYLVLTEGCGEISGATWTFHIPTKTAKTVQHRYVFGPHASSPYGNYQIILGETEDDGEVRTLRVIDFIKDEEWKTEPLPKHLSYKKTTSDFDGSPMGEIEWGHNSSGPRAKVFLANIPYNIGDERMPVLDDYIVFPL